MKINNMGTRLPERYQIRTRDINFNYVEWKGSDPQMLMLHGDMRTGRSFDAVSRELNGKYNIFAMDARGHGDSDWPETGYSIEDRIEDLAAFCKAAEIDNVIGIGHSLGGGIISLCNDRYEGIFQKLILLEPDFVFDENFYNRASFQANRQHRSWKDRRHLAGYLKQHEMASRWREDVIEDVVTHETQDLNDGSIAMKWSMKTFEVDSGATNLYDLRPDFRTTSTPILFILSEDNRQYYSDLSDIALENAGIKSIVISGTSHNMYMEKPDIVAELIDSYLNDEFLPSVV
jgi:pimeloyl-ACP methyl ester carboxylesterase